MHGRNRSSREVDSQRIVQNVNVKVQDVKLLGHPADFVEHDEMIRNGVCNVGIKPKGALAAGFKSSGGDRVGAGEESHVVTLPDQFLGTIGDDPLSSPIQLGWAALHQRCYLRDLH
jgi:hypothetical protein